jgi:putative transposase
MKKGAVGLDPHKRREGCKRQIVVDTQGWLLRVLVHPANEQDTVAARWLLRRLPFFTQLALFIFDSGYDSDAFWCQQVFGARTQIPTRGEQKGFQVVPKRWVVERTFGWLNPFRRLSKDYEQRSDIAEGFIYLSMIHLRLNRLTR